MTAQETHVANAAETTLTDMLSAGATTINVADTSQFPPVPFYGTIDAGNDSSREVVLVDGAKTSTTFTLSDSTKRGLDGTSDVQHESGAVISLVPVAALWTDINDRVDAVAASAVSDHGALSGLADDDHTQYALADGSRGNFEPTGTAAAEVAAHEAEVDPHPQYLTEADGNNAYEAKVNRTGATAGQVPVLQGDDSLSFEGMSGAPTSVLIPAPSMNALSGAPSEGVAGWATWQLDDSLTETVGSAISTDAMSGWSTYDIEIWWSTPGSETGDVRFMFESDGTPPSGVTDGGSRGLTTGYYAAFTAPGSFSINASAIASGLSAPSPGRAMGFEVGRTGAHADDTLTGDIHLHAVVFRKVS